MTTPPTIEYHPEPLVGTVTIQQSPNGIVITIAPTLRRIFLALAATLSVLLFVTGFLAILFFLTPATTHLRGNSWTMIIILLTIALISAVSGLKAIWPLLFPITFEVTQEHFIGRWRTITEAKSYIWARDAILGVRVDKQPVGKNLKKHRGLFVHHRDIGDVFVLRGSPQELEIIAQKLSQTLNLANMQPPALIPIKPDGCRFKRIKWRDGVWLGIPPRHAKFVAVGLLLIGLAIGWLPMHLLATQIDDETVYVPWAAGYARIALAIILAAIVWSFLWTITRKMRKVMVLAADSKNLHFIETSLFRPINIHWKHEEIAIAIQPDPHSPDRGSFTISPQQGPPLSLLPNEKLLHLQWLLAVLEAARPPKTSPTASTTPEPAHKSPPATDPAPQ